MSTRSFFYLIMLFSFFASPLYAQDETDIKTEKKVIARLEQGLFEAFIEKDEEKVLSFFAEDAELMPADMPSVKGREKIRTRIESVFNDPSIDWSIYSVKVGDAEMSASADLAVVVHKAFKPVEMKWLNVWKKMDGEWKCIITIDNSNKPAVPVPAALPEN